VREQGVGFGVGLEGFRGRVEGEGSAGGAGDVRKLRQAGAEVALLDPGVQLAGVAAARGGDPVSEVSLRV
jgi:hypothetical protein